MTAIYYGVYRVMPNGKHTYVSRSVTNNKKLAEAIADDLSHGIVIMPTGATKRVTPHPHVWLDTSKRKGA